MTIDATLDTTKLLQRSLWTVKRSYTTYRSNELGLIGIHTGGVWVANKIAGELQLKTNVGELNIAFYRDDFR